MKRMMVIAALVVSTSAWAIDFTTPLHAIGGGPFKDEKGQVQELILGQIAENALMASDQADRDGNEKMKSFLLALKLHEKGTGSFAKDANLSAEELSRIKDKIGKFYPPAVVGAAWSVIDPASVPK